MPRHYHDDDDMVYACPECDNTPVYRRQQKNTEIDRDKEFVCYECSTGFDEPVEREKHPKTTEGGMPSKLHQLGKDALDS